MSGEQRAVNATSEPVTVSMLRGQLKALDLPDDAVVVVHSSLSSLGWVAGGAHAVVLALMDVIAFRGTLVMPTHSGDLSDPARWRNPPVPEPWWETIREQAPAFDPSMTPTRVMGRIVECFRHAPGVRRSAHPHVSFAAAGRRAAEIVDGHELPNGLGEGSPLARIYDADGCVLLIGVGFDRCTMLHLAEFRAEYPGKEWISQGAPVMDDGERRWVEFGDLEGDTDDFEALGADYVATGAVTERPIGSGTMMLMRVRPLVDFAVGWFEANRGKE